MKVLMLSHGSRGDVQPFVALGVALNSAGHEAILGAPAALAPLARGNGVRFAPLRDTWKDLAEDTVVRKAFETNYAGASGKWRLLQVMRRFRPIMSEVLEDMAAAAEEDIDLVVYQPTVPGHEVAERAGVPAVPVCLQPIWIPTASFPNPMVPFQLPRALNRASYRVTPLWCRGFTGSTRKWRRDTLGLRHRRRSNNVMIRPDGTPATVLQAFSRHVLPSSPNYPDWVHTTGYWFLPVAPDWTPPRRLAEFLGAGEPPVYIGFGSLSGTDARRAGRIVVDAVRTAGVRAVVVTGWGGIQAGESAENLCYLDEAPFDWLFPRMAAIVHHGGSGTIGTALASGRPQVVCPFMTDQPFFARRMKVCGVAPDPLPQTMITARSLADAIGQVLSNPTLAARAHDLAREVRGEGGVKTAIRVLETIV